MLTSALHHTTDKAKSVFSSAALGDLRYTARRVDVAAQLEKLPIKSMPIASDESKAMQEGAYRFIRNPNVSESLRPCMRTVELARDKHGIRKNRPTRKACFSLRSGRIYMAIAGVGTLIDSKRTGTVNWDAPWESRQSKLDDGLLIS